MEDPLLIVSISASEEEPGEGEEQDIAEELNGLPEPLLLRLTVQPEEKALPAHPRVSSLELVQEVVLPPPEGHPLT